LIRPISSNAKIRHRNLKDALERRWKALAVGDLVAVRVGVSGNQDNCIARRSGAVHAQTVLVIAVRYLHTDAIFQPACLVRKVVPS
jgi:hypothetical protein